MRELRAAAPNVLLVGGTEGGDDKWVGGATQGTWLKSAERAALHLIAAPAILYCDPRRGYWRGLTGEAR